MRGLERILKEWRDGDVRLNIVGAFDNPLQALAFARGEPLDIAFLDIGMPEMNGLVLAEHLMEIHPEIHVVFVTAYHEYAIEAFEMNAVDYVLKPVHSTRLAKTMMRFTKAGPDRDRQSGMSSGRMPKICCMQNLHYVDHNGTPHEIRWRTQKVQELFAYLVFNRNKTVSKQVLLDLLWPDYDLDKSSTQLHTAIYQIRKVIKEMGWDLKIKFKDEGYRLVWGDLRLDVEEWEKKVSEASPVSPETLDSHLQLLSEYKGHFLEDHCYIWAEMEQERIRRIWLDYAEAVADCCYSSDQIAAAVSLYQLMRDRCPYHEEGYFALMRIHAEQGHHTDVIKLYEALEGKMWEEYGVEPNETVTDWYMNWKKRRSSK